MKISVKSSGFGSFRERIEKIKSELPQAIDDGIKAGVVILQQSAQDKVRVKTGNLKSNIKTRTESEGTKHTGIVYVDLDGAPYGAEVEHGSSGLPEGVILPVDKKVLHWVDDGGVEHFANAVYQPGSPFMRPAFEQDGPEAVEKAKDTICEGVK